MTKCGIKQGKITQGKITQDKKRQNNNTYDMFIQGKAMD